MTASSSSGDGGRPGPVSSRSLLSVVVVVVIELSCGDLVVRALDARIVPIEEDGLGSALLDFVEELFLADFDSVVVVGTG